MDSGKLSIEDISSLCSLNLQSTQILQGPMQ